MDKKYLEERWFLPLFVVTLFSPSIAWAADADTLGALLCNAKTAGTSYPYILNATAYIAGAFAAVRAFLLFKKHAENPSQSQIVSGIAHAVGAGFLLSLPTFAGVIQRSVMGSVSGSWESGCAGGAVGAASSLDVMMQNLVKNIHGPMFKLIAMISVIVGLTFIVRGLLAGVKTGTDPRASSPKTIIVNLVIGAVLISIGSVLPDILKTLFGTGDVSNMSSFSGIAWSKFVGSGVDTTAADNTVKAILAFIQIIGGIAFLRGWLIVKSAVEGGGQATIPQGVTHIVGGAMAVNIDVMLKIIDKTFGTGIIN
ncbi:MAG: hypothetical protein WC612_01375 [Bdellovibrionales bacterium]